MSEFIREPRCREAAMLCKALIKAAFNARHAGREWVARAPTSDLKGRMKNVVAGVVAKKRLSAIDPKSFGQSDRLAFLQLRDAVTSATEHPSPAEWDMNHLCAGLREFEQAVADAGRVVNEQPATAESPRPALRFLRAYSEFQRAVRGCGQGRPAAEISDDEIWEFLQANPPDEFDLPSDPDTFFRYVRKLKKPEEKKRSSRRGREGRSTVRHEER